ncbi:uncharacterized protein METZ01_LOCUS137271 [marine metagenome]|uniref:Uncharacterized protein n=1 Tax=marine metagenome TaxID=408172 RepID=A0A381Z6P8_9ZZZZ
MYPATISAGLQGKSAYGGDGRQSLGLAGSVAGWLCGLPRARNRILFFWR